VSYVKGTTSGTIVPGEATILNTGVVHVHIAGGIPPYTVQARLGDGGSAEELWNATTRQAPLSPGAPATLRAPGRATLHVTVVDGGTYAADLLATLATHLNAAPGLHVNDLHATRSRLRPGLRARGGLRGAGSTAGDPSAADRERSRGLARRRLPSRRLPRALEPPGRHRSHRRRRLGPAGRLHPTPPRTHARRLDRRRDHRHGPRRRCMPTAARVPPQARRRPPWRDADFAEPVRADARPDMGAPSRRRRGVPHGTRAAARLRSWAHRAAMDGRNPGHDPDHTTQPAARRPGRRGVRPHKHAGTRRARRPGDV
jgi:hypothetical protein